MFAIVAFMAICIAVVPQILTVRAYNAVRPFRIDISPGTDASAGRSRLWQLNVLRKANYSAEGQVYVRRLWLWLGISQLTMIVDIALLAWRFP